MRLIDYNDLVTRGIVRSRMTLWRLIKTHGFPEGVLVTPNRRAWNEADVDAWIGSRPTAPKAGTPKATVIESATA